MEKLILNKDLDEIYELEINDKGDKIVFDLTDLKLIEKIMTAGDNIEKLGKDLAKKEQEIYEKNKGNEVELVKELIKLDNEHSKKMRGYLDSFLGEGTCYKIFGEKENIGQYNMLFDALQPHFQKMKIQKEKAQQKLINKYMNKEDGIL